MWWDTWSSPTKVLISNKSKEERLRQNVNVWLCSLFHQSDKQQMRLEQNSSQKLCKLHVGGSHQPNVWKNRIKIKIRIRIGIRIRIRIRIRFRFRIRIRIRIKIRIRTRIRFRIRIKIRFRLKKFLNPFCFACTLGLLPCLCRSTKLNEYC